MKRLLCVALLLLPCAAAWAGPCVVGAPLLPSAPKIDGDLSDAAWQQAAVVRGFVVAGKPNPEVASPLTTMRVGYTKQALYVAFECDEPRLDRLVAAKPERDYAMGKADSVSLYFVFGPQWRDEHYIEIACDCTGVQHDSYERDHSWNGAWKCATGRTQSAWTVEFEIPFADVRYTLKGGDAWWLVVERNRLAGGRDDEGQSWCPAPNKIRSAEAAGRLVFGALAENTVVDAAALAADTDRTLPLLRGEAARTDEGRAALTRIEAIRAQAQAWSSPAGALTPEQWQARRAEIEQARARFESLYWTVRFAALLDG